MKLQYYETCNSQYHRGHHMPVVQVMVDGETTVGAVREALLDNFAYAHLEESLLKSDGHYEAYREAVDECFADIITDGFIDNLWDRSLGVPEEDQEDWDCYSYFVLTELAEHLNQSLRKDGSVCPFCKCDELEIMETDGSGHTMDVKVQCCNTACQEHWTEHYTLDGATFSEEFDYE